ncbi:TRAP transporter large permease subunit [Celeribacter halophilus]|uniref:TRAP transporter large permease n=1 Tax=Celeribacter halophilus TaxID=576117 RepID=UPI0026E3A203|nr:TRAP transporter large permease subunit [Celeribacter halophilus]MDO6725107.1 TRAP transporter large permease subunit [Celeribacter halophilus]
MADGTLIVLMMSVLVSLIMLGVPLAFATGFVATAFGFALFGDMVFWIISSRTYGMLNEYSLLSVPMFVFMAMMMEKAGIGADLFRAMNSVGRRLPGSLAVQTLIVAMLLASMSGIIGGEIVLLGLIALPQMLKLGYDKKLAIGTVVAGGSLGTMIPPSIVLVFYGITASVSVADLFAAVIVPGLILSGSYVAYIVIRVVRNSDLAPRGDEGTPSEAVTASWRERFNILMPIMLAITVLGSIYAGIASVTEAAAFGAFGTIFAAWLRGSLNWRLLLDTGRETFLTAGVLFWVTFGANALVGVFTFMNGQNVVTTFFNDDLNLSPLMTILVINLILVLLGMFIDWIGILLLTVPIFLPLIVELGYDPIWFGVIFCLNMQISYLTPPFAPAAVYLKSVAPKDISLADIFSASWPFILLQVLNLILMVLFPQLVLWLT